jgi:hypothetical protein
MATAKALAPNLPIQVWNLGGDISITDRGNASVRELLAATRVFSSNN